MYEEFMEMQEQKQKWKMDERTNNTTNGDFLHEMAQDNNCLMNNICRLALLFRFICWDLESFLIVDFLATFHSGHSHRRVAR